MNLRYRYGLLPILALLIPMLGCQRMAHITVQNDAPFRIFVYDTLKPEWLLGTVETHTTATLGKSIILRGTEPMHFRIKNGKGKTLKDLLLTPASTQQAAQEGVFFRFDK